MGMIRISESDDFVVDYDKEKGAYRVSVFEDNHFKDEYYFDAYEDKEVSGYIKEEFDKPIQDLYGAAVMLCLALNLNNNGCKNCPVTLHNYEKRTEYDKTCLHESCQMNLYKWLLEKAKDDSIQKTEAYCKKNMM